MTSFVKTLSLAFVAACVIGMAAQTARADEVEALCIAGNPMPGADKMCKCVSDKLTGGDRTQAIAMMKATNDAMTKGGAMDPTSMTPDMQQSMVKVTELEAKCMQ